MNKNVIISNLIQIAEVLDSKQMFSQAERLTNVMVKIAQITTGEDERDLEKLENEQILSRLKDVPTPLGEDKPELGSGPGNIIDVNDKKFVIPSKLTMEKTFDGKKFRLEIDEESGNLYYIYREDNKPNLVVPVDKKSGNTQEVRGKGRVNLLRMFGIDKIFGKAKLPRLSPVEQYVRRKVVPEATKVVKPLGNAARDLITRPLLTNPLGAVADDLGLSTTGRDQPFMADAKHQLGNSDDRSTVPTNVENSSAVDIKNESKLPEPTGPEAVAPSNPTGSTPGGSGGSGGSGGGMMLSKNQIRDIKSPEDLLFWSMMVGDKNNQIKFRDYDRSKEKEYYSQERHDSTKNYIMALSESKWANSINPELKGFQAEALSKLENKTNMQKQSMTKLNIVNRLNKLAQMFDEMNMPEQADDVTNVMENISDSPEKKAWHDYAFSLAKKDPDFIPPRKPRVEAITFEEVTNKALLDYHLYKNNKKQTSKFRYEEENKLKELAKNADRAR